MRLDYSQPTRQVSMKNDVDRKNGRRNWFALSLKTAFLVLTLLCIWLGFVVSAARRQERIVEAVCELGGYIEYDYEWDSEVRQMIDWEGNGGVGPAPEPAGPSWLRGLIGKHYFCSVVWVYLPATPDASDELVADIGQLSELRYLCLHGCSNVTDAGIRQLPSSLPLISLDLDSTALSDAGVRHVSRLKNLEQLYIRNTNATANCSQFIRDIKHLKRIGVDADVMPDSEIEELRDRIPNLRVSRE